MAGEEDDIDKSESGSEDGEQTISNQRLVEMFGGYILFAGRQAVLVSHKTRLMVLAKHNV